MEFHFIDNNTPLDRRALRQVRSHAMKGKNSGRTFPARGHSGRRRQDEACSRPGSLSKGGDGIMVQSRHSQPMPVVSLQNPFSGAEWFFFPTPVNVTPQARLLFYELHHNVSKDLYPTIFCRRSREGESSWFDSVMGSPSAFHCGLAMTGAYRSRFLGHSDESLGTAQHFLHAIRLLRLELSASPSSPTDSSIAVVVSLAVHANLHGAAAESRLHLNAMQRLLALRPCGLASLCATAPEVANKIRRTDVELALMTGTETIFGSQPSPQPAPVHAVAVVPSLFSARRLPLPHVLGQRSEAVRAAAQDILALCSLAGLSQLGAFQYQDLVVSISQRLVDSAALHGMRPSDPLDSICQLGLLAFMTTVFYRTRKRRCLYSALLFDMLRTELRSLVLDDVGDIFDEAHLSLYLWLTMVYAVASPMFEEQCRGTDGFILQNIRTLAKILGLNRWQDVQACLSAYPWIAAFHDQPGKVYLECAMQT